MHSHAWQYCGYVTTNPMPKWVPRAIVLFWMMFLAALVARELFHQLSSFLLLVLVSIFLAFAIEPGVNRLAKRGWRRGSGTLLIIFGVITFIGVFLGAVGTLVGSQVADVLKNSEMYVNDTVDFVNDTFNANIDPAEVNASIADPKGPVQKFIKNQQGKVISLSVNALGASLQLLTIVLFTFYFVADGPRLRRVICSRLPEAKQRAVLRTWDLAIAKTGGYLYSRASACIGFCFLPLDCIPSNWHTSAYRYGAVGRNRFAVLASCRNVPRRCVAVTSHVLRLTV
jgi:predicted PurR-regulated permease PerM